MDVMRKLMRLIIFLLLLSNTFFACTQKIKETWVIPDGFQGRINVVFNQPNAAPIPELKGRRIYKIPDDGILLTSSKLKAGFIDQQFYYEKKIGGRTRIPVQDGNGVDVPLKPAVVYKGSNGVYGSSDEPNPFEFSEIVVASKETNDSIFNSKAMTLFQERVMAKAGKRL
jgi:hypothetical protein